MSEPNRNTSAGQSSSGPENQTGGNPNRNRNRNNNNNRNRNRNRNRDSQGQENRERGGKNDGGNPNRRRHNNAEGRKKTPKVVPLTMWQKVMKFFGLYKPETPAARPPRKEAERKERPPRKENVRDASGRSGRSHDDGDDAPARSGGGGGKTARARQKPRPTPDSSGVEGTRLYVGNLSYDASEHDLEDLLKGVGAVRKIDIVYNRNTHRSKGYGFVEMGRVDEAKRAVEVLHDQPFMGRTLIVNSAKSTGPMDEDGDEAPHESPPASIPVNEE